jgi:hypothetical protein
VARGLTAVGRGVWLCLLHAGVEEVPRSLYALAVKVRKPQSGTHCLWYTPPQMHDSAIGAAITCTRLQLLLVHIQLTPAHTDSSTPSAALTLALTCFLFCRTPASARAAAGTRAASGAKEAAAKEVQVLAGQAWALDPSHPSSSSMC